MLISSTWRRAHTNDLYLRRAGGTAVLMVRNVWTSADALSNVGQVQDFLNSSHVGAPRVWSLSGITPSLPTGRVCELGRCLSGPGSLAPPSRRYNGTTCPASASDCAPLAHNEWLANADFWTTARVVIILLWISPLWAWFARAIYGSVVRQVSSPERRLSL